MIRLFQSVRIYVLQFTAFIFITCQGYEKADFYIATDGDDKNPGTEALPFATIKRAQESVRQKAAGGMDADIVVEIKAGEYLLEKSIRFDQRDSGRNGHKIIYRNHADEKPVLTAGRRINNWQKQPNSEIWTAQLKIR